MRARTSARWPLLAVCGQLSLVALATVLAVLGNVGVELFDAGMTATFLVLGLLGALLSRRRPDNRIGALLVVTSLPMLLYGVAVVLAEIARARPHTPMAWLGTWATLWLWMPSITLLALTIFLFPSGEAPSPRWRSVPALMLGQVVAVVLASLALLPGWDTAASHATTPSELPGGLALDLVGNMPLPMLLLIACAGLVVRFRRAQGVERLQLRWLRLAVIALVAVTLSPFVIPVGDPTSAPWYTIGCQVAILGIPASMTLAILRYRLYDIDRLVSRAISYAAVVVVLALTYLASVLALGSLARAVTGESGDLVVALSTLAVAALFHPLRHGVQELVDSRFNRARYDAAQTVADFARDLRDEVRADSVVARLRGTVAASVDPASVGIVVLGRVEEVAR